MLKEILSLFSSNRCIAHPQKLFYDVPIIDEAYLTVLCQKIYFPAEEYTIAVFITVHTSLYYLFRDLPPAAARELGLTACERDDIVATCKKNAEMAMRNVRLFMETNYENIEAITLSVRSRLHPLLKQIARN